MSIAEILVVTLTFAYLAVGVVAFVGWRSRMRSPVKMRHRNRAAYRYVMATQAIALTWERCWLARPSGRPRALSSISWIRKEFEK